MPYALPSPHLSAQRVRAELRRLYLRRSAIDHLIEAIVFYNAQPTAMVEQPDKMEPDTVSIPHGRLVCG
ncbi:MAG: hypothetical protein IT165_15280 [Bryobacterales bacterium]|nr:hypothetical protein [Bryobacterales bacterium]